MFFLQDLRGGTVGKESGTILSMTMLDHALSQLAMSY